MNKNTIADLLRMQEEQNALQEYRKAFDRAVKVVFGISSSEIRKLISEHETSSINTLPAFLTSAVGNSVDDDRGIDAHETSVGSDYF